MGAEAAQENADSRIKELILYIAGCCYEYGTLGATKLNRILFYSDFAGFLEFGHSITGQTYFALDYGPAPRRLKPIREEMEKSGDIQVIPANVSGGYIQHLIFPKRKPSLEHFTADEIALVDRMIARFCHKTARDTSNE